MLRPEAQNRAINALGRALMGAVLIEQSNQQILGLQRAQLERALYSIIAACVAIAAILWGFALRLVWRIHRLRDEASAAYEKGGALPQAFPE